MMKKKIFISHSSQDNEFVKNLCDGLEIQGFETWVELLASLFKVIRYYRAAV